MLTSTDESTSEITLTAAVWTWGGAAVLAAGSLALEYGFRHEVLSPAAIHIIMAAGLALFALSRVLLVLPAGAMAERLRRWWVDYVLLAAAGVWRLLEPASQNIILQLASIYILVVTAISLGSSGMGVIIRAAAGRARIRPLLYLSLTGLALALIGGAVLALPACWSKPYTGEKAAQYAKHALDCLFTAASALTGTGLTPLDIGNDFTLGGQAVLLVLMQMGGLLVLVMGSVIAWRLRQLLGWGGEDEMASAAGLRRLIAFVVTATIALEVAGAAALYRLWDPLAESGGAAGGGPRALAALFHSVSAFCNVGLVLPREGLARSAGAGSLYGVIVPLIVLGGLGGTVLYDLWRCIKPAQGAVRKLPRESRVTLIATGALIAAGAGLLYGIESTAQWQLRYPKETGERLRLWHTAPQGAIVFASDERAQLERLRTMPPGERAPAAVFTSVSARTAGVQTLRLDEPSVSPSGRCVLMGLMLVGGGLGGAAGGLRIPLVAIVLVAVFAPRTRGLRPMAVAAAFSVLVGMALLIAATTLILSYRESGSFEACLFEAVSACCNVGFSTGLTAQLSPAGRILLVLAMLLGRVLPLAILLRALQGNHSSAKER